MSQDIEDNTSSAPARRAASDSPVTSDKKDGDPNPMFSANDSG